MNKLLPITELPGAGLPARERKKLNLVFKTGSWVMPKPMALFVFRQACGQVVDLVKSLALEQQGQRVLIRRLAGLEDSSRNWSALMVVDHLNQVNGSIRQIIQTLAKGDKFETVVDTANVKPDGDVGAQALNEFLESTASFANEMAKLNGLRKTPTHAHPWFGELTAHRWLCLAAVHTRIHRKQLQAIRTGLKHKVD